MYYENIFYQFFQILLICMQIYAIMQKKNSNYA